MLRPLGLSLLISLSSASVVFAAGKPLFQKGRETFRIINEKSQSPVFHLFTSSPAKQALAMAVNSAFDLQPGKDGSVEVRLENLFLEPEKKKNQSISMTLLVSGHEVETGFTLNRTELESGKITQVRLPKQSKDFEMLKLTAQGSFSLQYLKSQDMLKIDKASLKIDVDSPLGDEEPESIQFSGRALRQN